jgi:ribosomal protein L9
MLTRSVGVYMCLVGLVFRFGRFGDVVTVDCGFATAFGKRSTGRML